MENREQALQVALIGHRIRKACSVACLAVAASLSIICPRRHRAGDGGGFFARDGDGRVWRTAAGGKSHREQER